MNCPADELMDLRKCPPINLQLTSSTRVY